MRTPLNLWLPLLIVFLAFCATAVSPALAQHEVRNPCPGAVEDGRAMTESFLTKATWAEERDSTNTTGISADQVQVVTDRAVCRTFNQEYQGFISAGKGDPQSGGYEAAYYKADNFYFAVLLVTQPEDPDRGTLGYTYLFVHDSNLDRVGGYFF